MTLSQQPVHTKTHKPPTVEKITPFPHLSKDLSNRNSNVVYGIPECRKGEPCRQRWKLDLLYISNLFKQPPASISPSSISDCQCLGRYSSDSNSHPRPILVKFNSCNVVMDILSHKSTFNPYIVKPNLAPNEHA